MALSLLLYCFDIDGGCERIDKATGRGGGGCSETRVAPPAFDEEGEETRFIDPITQSVMRLPMVLPSGKTIDYSTLQRIVEDKDNGKDPFSGVKLRESDCVVNLALKDALDRRALARAAAEGRPLYPAAPRAGRPWAAAAAERRTAAAADATAAAGSTSNGEDHGDEDLHPSKNSKKRKTEN